VQRSGILSAFRSFGTCHSSLSNLNFELHQFSNPADWEVYPTMKIHRFQLAYYLATALLADGRANVTGK
jgi:hypothetical protein